MLQDTQAAWTTLLEYAVDIRNMPLKIEAEAVQRSRNVQVLQTRLEREWNKGTEPAGVSRCRPWQVATSYTLDGCTSTSERAPNQKIFCVAPAAAWRKTAELQGFAVWEAPQVTDGYDVTETDLREHVFQVTARCAAGYSGSLHVRARDF